MDVNAFDAIAELKNFFDGKGELEETQSLFPSNKVVLAVERTDSAINLSATHPLRLYAKDLYNTLVRLFLITATDLTVDFLVHGSRKNVSKRFSPNEDIDEIIDDLLGLPHDNVIDVIIDTDAFKIVETQDTSDHIAITMKKGDSKLLFRSLVNYLCPFINTTIDTSIKEELTISKEEDEGKISIDLEITTDNMSRGVKSKTVKLV